MIDIIDFYTSDFQKSDVDLIDLLTDGPDVLRAGMTWDEAKHPTGGNPENAGQFSESSGGTGGAEDETTLETASEPGKPDPFNQSFEERYSIADSKTANGGYYDVLENWMNEIGEPKNEIGINGQAIEANQMTRAKVKQKLISDIAGRINLQMTNEQMIDFIKELPAAERVEFESKGADPRVHNVTPEKFAQALSDRLVHKWADTSDDHDALAIAVQERAVAMFGIEGHHNRTEDAKLRGQPSVEKARQLSDKFGHVFDAFLKATYDNTQETLKKHGIEELVVYRGMTLPKDKKQEMYSDSFYTSPADQLWEFQRQLSSQAHEIMPTKGDYALRWLNDKLDSGHISREQYDKYFELEEKAKEEPGLSGDELYEKNLKVHLKSEMQLQPLSSFSTDWDQALSFSTMNQTETGMPAVIMSTRIPRERIFSTALTGPGCLVEAEVVLMGGKLPCDFIAFDPLRHGPALDDFEKMALKEEGKVKPESPKPQKPPKGFSTPEQQAEFEAWFDSLQEVLPQ